MRRLKEAHITVLCIEGFSRYYSVLHNVYFIKVIQQNYPGLVFMAITAWCSFTVLNWPLRPLSVFSYINIGKH